MPRATFSKSAPSVVSQVGRSNGSDGNNRNNGGSVSAGSADATLRRSISLLQSEIASRLNFAARAGLTFRDQRNLDRSLGRLEKIKPSNYYYRYKRGGIARRIITKLPESAWREAPKVLEDPDASRSTKWESEVSKVFDRLSAWQVLPELHKLSRIGRYGILVMTLPESYGEPKTALINSRLASPDHLIRLTPYPEALITVTRKITDKSNPQFSWPEIYRVQVDEDLSLDVHHTRVIHYSRSFGAYHDPVLECCWDRLDDYDKVVGGISEKIYQLRKTQWTTTNKDTVYAPGEQETYAGQDVDLDAYKTPAGTIEKQITAWRHDAISDLILDGLEGKSVGGEVPDVSNHIEKLARDISASTGYPERVLFGTEEGKLAGEQDSKQYHLDVQGMQNGECNSMTRMLIDRLTALRVLSSVGDYTIERDQLDTISLEEKSTTAFTFARANVMQNKITGRPVLTGDEIRAAIGYDELSEQSIDTVGDSGDDGNQNSNDLRTLQADSISIVAEVVESSLSDDIEELIDSAVGDINVSNTTDSAVDTALEILTEQLEPLSDILESAALRAGIANTDSANDAGTFVNAGSAGSTDNTDNTDNTTSGIDNAPLRQLAISFNTDNTVIPEWAVEHATLQIQDIVEDQRIGLQSLITAGANNGWTPAQITSRMSSSIGLASNQIEWVIGLSSNLANAAPGTTVVYGSSKVKIGLGGISQLDIDRYVDGYIDTLLQQRKRRLARSLLAAAANEGLHESYRQAQAAGELPANTFRIYLKNTERHADRHGQLAAIGEPFPVEPGADANCACAQGLTVVN